MNTGKYFSTVYDIHIIRYKLSQTTRFKPKINKRSGQHNGFTHRRMDADPDPAFHFNADPDPAFHFNEDPDQDPHQGEANLRPLAYRLFKPLF
jgi:hypothetical protein